MASTREIGDQLVALCNEGRNIEVVEQYYSPDIVSVEAMDCEETPAEVQGIDAIRQKHQQWYDTMEVCEGKVHGPYMHGSNRFAALFSYKTRERASGKEMNIDEVAVYTVADGKIVREEFYYTMD